MMAACQPERIASMAAAKATAVLPLPTSPWRSRFMGSGDPMSEAISAKARSCARVKAKGTRARAAWRAAGEASKAIPGSRRTPRRRSASASWRKKSSSKARRRKGPVARAAARTMSVPGGGKWAWASAAARPSRKRRSRIPSGSSSTASGAYSSTSRFMSFRSAGCW